MKSLPQNDLPTYTTNIPSTGQPVVYRPMRVKEQRNLMTAQDSTNKEIYRVMKLCVDDCTFGKLDVDSLPNFDIEFLFIQIRIMSIGETMKVDVTCPSCSFIETKDMHLSNTRIERLSQKQSVVKLSDTLSLEMRYPSIEEIGLIEDKADSDSVFAIVRDCIVKIFSGEEVFEKGDFSDDELKNWLEDCTDTQFRNLEDFIVNSPYLISDVDNKCEKCGTETKYSLKGIRSFFA
jgi:T4 bacteriophage base plate protein